MMHLLRSFCSSLVLCMLMVSPLVGGCATVGTKSRPVIIPTKDQVGAKNLPDAIAPVKAPFAMPKFKKPVFPDRTIDITAHGAEQGKLARQQIQAAIDEAHAKGGGTVVIPKGNWLTGRIELKSNVNLRIDEGAVVTFSDDVADYRPAVFTRNEGVEVMSLGALIYANGQDNIAVTGKGTLYGPTKESSVRKQVMNADVVENFIKHTTPVAERVYEGHDGGFIFLPMFISPINCTNVYIEGITLERTPFWNIVPVYCDGVIIRGVTVNSVGIPRGDGIDVESSRNVLIEYSTLNNGDDCFTLKAGRGEDGMRVNKPTENVVIRHCLAMQGHGGITCGSETAGVIRNLYVHDTVFDNTGTGIRFKTRRPRGGGGENLIYERIRMNLNGPAFDWDMLGSRQYVGELANRLPALPVNRLTPMYRNITAKDIVVEKSTRFFRAKGIPESPLTNVTIENAEINSKELINATDLKGLTIRNATITSEQSTITLNDARDVVFENVQFIVPGALETKISGDHTDNIQFKNTVPEKPSGWESGSYRK